MDASSRISLIADVALFSAGKVVLVRYSDTNAYDHQRGWFLPDDAVHHLEHPDDAARRILRAQLGLADTSPTLDHIESFTGKDRSWHLVFHYRIECAISPVLHPSTDVAELDWFDPDALPPRKEVAHGGWALGTIRTMANRAIPI